MVKNGVVTAKIFLWKISIHEVPTYNAETRRLTSVLLRIACQEGPLLSKSARDILTVFVTSYTAQVTVLSAKDKGSDVFVWRAQRTLSSGCPSYLQSANADFCSLQSSLMDVHTIGLMGSGFNPENNFGTKYFIVFGLWENVTEKFVLSR